MGIEETLIERLDKKKTRIVLAVSILGHGAIIETDIDLIELIQ